MALRGAAPDPAPGALPPSTVSGVLDAVLASDPERQALVGRSGTMTYEELDRAAARAAGALRDLGVRAGDRVAACLPNDLDIVVAFHGALRLGAVWVGVNSVLAPPEKSFILRDAEASLLLCDETVAGEVAQMGPTELPPALRAVRVAGRGAPADEWGQALGAARDLRPAPPRPEDPAGIAYTSGTTGVPKGVVHSHRNLLLPGAATVVSRCYGPGLRKGDCLPFTILNLMVLGPLLVAQAGGCCVVMDRRDAPGIAAWLRDERVTVWNGVPAMLYGMLEDPGIVLGDLPTLAEVWAGGSDFPELLRSRLSERWGVPLYSTYGLTEAPTLVTIEAIGAPHVPGSSGRALPHLAVLVLGPDDAPVPSGETGEICLAPVGKGPWAGMYRPMLGYWRNPEATAETLAGGVVHTGDLGCVDDDGNLFVRDRRTLVIIRGGANVYPAEVERVLLSIPGVTGCAVVGVPDDRLGERVAAAVELSAGSACSEAELQARCASELARYKVPERVVVVDALPRNSMGKVTRTAVAAMVAGAVTGGSRARRAARGGGPR